MARTTKQNKTAQQNKTAESKTAESKTTSLEKMMAEVERLRAENARLKQDKGQRPEGAMWVPGGAIYWPHGTRKDLVGKRVSLQIPQDAVNFHITGLVKESSNGNAYCKIQGWVDTRKLDLDTAVVRGARKEAKKSSAEKATRNMKDLV